MQPLLKRPTAADTKATKITETNLFVFVVFVTFVIFVSLPPAVSQGTFGPSWLHRWRVAKKLPPRLTDEPDPPRWILDLSK